MEPIVVNGKMMAYEIARGKDLYTLDGARIELRKRTLWVRLRNAWRAFKRELKS